MRWVRILVKSPAAAEDSVAPALLDAGCGGTEHSPSGVAGYLPVDDTLEGRLQSLRARLDSLSAEFASPEMILTFVEEEDWANAWKAHFHPLPIGDRLVIAPSWSDYQPQPGQVVVELDPGMAFGTGAHPTTQLCLRALEEIITGGEIVLDWGTGSGLLAIAALKLGAKEAVAGDIDPLAVRIAEENAVRNHLESRMRFQVGETPDELDLLADVTVCNILAGVIMALSDSLAASTRLGGRLIASGIIDSRSDEVQYELKRAGFRITDVRTQGEWVAIICDRVGNSEQFIS